VPECLCQGVCPRAGAYRGSGHRPFNSSNFLNELRRTPFPNCSSIAGAWALLDDRWVDRRLGTSENVLPRIRENKGKQKGLGLEKL
jgi:hypothetical protein